MKIIIEPLLEVVKIIVFCLLNITTVVSEILFDICGIVLDKGKLCVHMCLHIHRYILHFIYTLVQVRTLLK